MDAPRGFRRFGDEIEIPATSCSGHFRGGFTGDGDLFSALIGKTIFALAPNAKPRVAGPTKVQPFQTSRKEGSYLEDFGKFGDLTACCLSPAQIESVSRRLQDWVMQTRRSVVFLAEAQDVTDKFLIATAFREHSGTHFSLRVVSPVTFEDVNQYKYGPEIIVIPVPQ